MSIEQMTDASYFLFAMAAAFGIAAVVLFFALNIPRCFRMVTGKRVKEKKRREKEKPVQASCTDTEKLHGTQLLMRTDAEGKPAVSGRETVLMGSQETVLLAAGSMELIQDIVYMQEE